VQWRPALSNVVYGVDSRDRRPPIPRNASKRWRLRTILVPDRPRYSLLVCRPRGTLGRAAAVRRHRQLATTASRPPRCYLRGQDWPPGGAAPAALLRALAPPVSDCRARPEAWRIDRLLTQKSRPRRADPGSAHHRNVANDVAVSKRDLPAGSRKDPTPSRRVEIRLELNGRPRARPPRSRRMPRGRGRGPPLSVASAGMGSSAAGAAW
jgi:hypothetical protein